MSINTREYVRKYIPTPSEFRISGAEQWGCTGVNVVQIKYMWKIENFSFFSLNDEIYSQCFSARHYNKIQWRLSIKWNGDCLDLYVNLVESDKAQVCYKLVIDIMKSKREFVNYYKNQSLSSASKLKPKCHVLSILKSDLFKHCCCLDDTLTLVCQIETVVGFTYSKPSAISDQAAFEGNFREDLWKLFQNGLFCDMTLVAGCKELKVHKVVLAAHSDVFTVMFQYKLEESKANRVVITDIDADVLQEMLHFMYLGKSPNMKTMAAKLLHAADKYAIGHLKMLCEIELGDNISTDTAISIFELAQRHSSKGLEVLAKNFIKDNINDWENILLNYSD